MDKPTIKHRFTRAVLFEGEAGMTTRQMLEKATVNKVDLRFADLRSADLSFANLRFADLSFADLRSANLSFANLRSADLSFANLRSADLSFADLRSANLSFANLRSADLSSADLSFADLRSANLSFGKAVGSRPYFAIGPIGSRCDYAQLWLTDKGAFVKAGCFTGSLDEFSEACIKTHGDSDHGKEYAMSVLMFEAHANLWTPNEIEVAA